MQNTTTQEILVGLFVACGIAALFFMAMQISNLSSLSKDQVYTISAAFENSGGLKVKSSVSVAGVRIGRVSAISLDKESYYSIVKMQIDSQYNLPEDTSASIFTAGILGEQYIGLDPGGSDEHLKDQDSIEITQPALILEQLVFKFFTNKEDKAEE